MDDILFEDHVVDAVCDDLWSRGYRITQPASARERCEDIVAEGDGRRVVVEAKGGGSSQPGSARYGERFTRAQVFDHVAKAVLKALRVASSGEGHAAVGLPDNPDHRDEVAQVADALDRLGVTVLWVGRDRRVTIDGP